MKVKKFGMKKILSVFLALCLAMGLTSAAQAQKSAPEKKTFVFGDTTFNPENGISDINPHNDYSGWATIRYGVGETLFRYSKSMGIQPWLAKSYEFVDDHTWKITLQKNVHFTSGRRLDAQA